ncbi:MAG: hypothetical protein KDB50_13390 [Mycobacterium sp.]|nr:hypothetical protein [Mycobacterium sp.]
MDDLGGRSALVFYGESSSASLSIPVPPGLIPTALNVTLDFPFKIRSGTLSIDQGDRPVGKLGLPVANLAPLVIPLDGVEVINGLATLGLTLNAVAEDGYCLDPLNPIEFVNGSVTYAGTEVGPATIADFLPALLQTVLIGLPSSPSRAESEAALQLAAALQVRYRGKSPQVVLVPLSGDVANFDGPPQPMERRIVIKQGSDEGVSLSFVQGVPQLLVSGPEGTLTNQARLLTHSSVRLAVSTKAVADKSLSPNIALPGDSATLEQLGQPSLGSVGVSPTVSIALDQTRFGHPTQGYRVHVVGSHTPVPADIGARVTASVDGQLVDSWSTGGDGIIDHWVDVPDRLIQRFTNLAIGVDTTGAIGPCGDFRPITLTINGNSLVESTPSEPPIPPGFQSMPQALMPRAQVGLSEGGFADTVRATQIVVGLQRISAVPLSIQLTSYQQAIGSEEPAILISADGWTDTSIALPVSADNSELTLMGLNPGDEETTLTLDPELRFGSLQTVFDGRRSLLIATSNGAPAQLDELLIRLTAGSGMWSQLRNNAVVGIAGRDPEMVPDRTPVSVYGPPAPAEVSVTDGNPGWSAAVGAVVVLGVGAVAYWMGTRRSLSGSGQSPRHDAHSDEES